MIIASAHKHGRFQPTISAKRKCCRTTLHTNGPTLFANSPQTTARTHTPCQRTTPRQGGQNIYLPITDSFRDSRRTQSLASQGRPGAPSGKTTHPFWDSCLQMATSDKRAPSGSMAMPTVVRQIERTELVEK